MRMKKMLGLLLSIAVFASYPLTVYAEAGLMEGGEPAAPPTEIITPSESAAPSEGNAPAEPSAPTETSPVEGTVPVEGNVPAEGAAPSEGGEAPAEESGAGETRPAEETTPAESTAPSESEAPSETTTIYPTNPLPDIDKIAEAAFANANNARAYSVTKDVYRYYGSDPALGDYYKSKEGVPFSSFLEDFNSYTKETLPAADIVSVDDTENLITYNYLPTKFRTGELRKIGLRLKSDGGTVVLPVKKMIKSDFDGAEYSITFTAKGLNGFSGIADLDAAVNPALVATRNSSRTGIILRAADISEISSRDCSFQYNVRSEYVLAFARAISESAEDAYEPLELVDKSGNVIRNGIDPDNNLIFSIGKDVGWEVRLRKMADTNYITRTEANAKLEDLKKEINELRSNYNNLDLNNSNSELSKKLKTMEKDIASTQSSLTSLTSESRINSIIKNYINDPKNIEVITAIVFERFKSQLSGSLGGILSKDEIDYALRVLAVHIVDEISKALGGSTSSSLDKLEEKITKAIREELLSILAAYPDHDSMMEYLLALAVLQNMGSLQGPAGPAGPAGAQGAQGIQGEKGDKGDTGASFVDYVNQYYNGGMTKFIKDISFEGWVERNYGTIDNFKNQMKGSNGLSAYDLAVQQGYRGTLGQWLESLQGRDGKSAYELAVQQGFRGTLNEWLASLEGEDGQDGRDGKNGANGKDGRDGRDGRDGQVVYVNGTYAQVPSSGTITITGSDDYDTIDDYIVLDPVATAPFKGEKNPATGVAAGILLPAAAGASILLIRKKGRSRGRRK